MMKPTGMEERCERGRVRDGLPSVAALIVLSLLMTLPAHAQLESRAQQLEVIRRDRQARLWPERQSPVVTMANGFIARADGSGEGTNGFQPVVFGGMRAGQGFAYGIGYRRSDIWRDRVAFRFTASGTIRQAFMFRLNGEFPGLIGRRGLFEYEAKYENSPQMDYYGAGADSEKANRSSYLLEDTDVTFRLGYQFTRRFSALADVGGYFVNVGPGSRDGVPSIEEVFDPADVPGMAHQTNYFRWGGVARFDYRDNSEAPTSGGYYVVRLSHYSDRSLRENGFIRLTGSADQFLPYRNGTRVVALRVEGQMAFTDAETNQEVPFYLQPTLGGNNRLRGFADYRFYDTTSVMGIAEHRWYVFSGMDAAVFVEAGAVSPRNAALLAEPKWGGGLSFRFKMFDSFFMRFDNAFSDEGYRMIFTFTDAFNLEERW